MKKLIVAIAMSALAVGLTSAQTLNANYTFTNIGSGASVTDPAGNLLGRVNNENVFWAISYVQTETDGPWAEVGLPAPFVANGLFSRQLIDPPSNAVVLDGVAGGTTINLIVRAWDSRTGATYDAATTKAESDPISLLTGNDTSGGTPTLPPTTLTGLQSFQLEVVPEPSTIALALLGAGLLLFRRRK
jgi:hypothetical protein